MINKKLYFLWCKNELLNYFGYDVCFISKNNASIVKKLNKKSISFFFDDQKRKFIENFILKDVRDEVHLLMKNKNLYYLIYILDKCELVFLYLIHPTHIFSDGTIDYDTAKVNLYQGYHVFTLRDICFFTRFAGKIFCDYEDKNLSFNDWIIRFQRIFADRENQIHSQRRKIISQDFSKILVQLKIKRDNEFCHLLRSLKRETGIFSKTELDNLYSLISQSDPNKFYLSKLPKELILYIFSFIKFPITFTLTPFELEIKKLLKQ